MSIYIERLWFLAALLATAWALVAAGFHWALWAVRTGRVDLDKMRAKLKG